MSTFIHPTALVEDNVQLGVDVHIGPYSYLGTGVTLGDKVKLFSHAVIMGRTTVGEACTFYPFASIGHAPQDLKYRGEPSTLEIGSHTTIREYVTMQPGTEGGGMVTRIGDHGLFMAGVHVAHDCQVGNHVIMANQATLGGHVTIGNYAIVGGLAAIHQFVRIGEHAMIGGKAAVAGDVIPYGTVMGPRAVLEGLNVVGLKRRHFSRQEIQGLREAYHILFKQETGPINERIEKIPQDLGKLETVQSLLNFVQEGTNRSLCTVQ